MKYILLYIPKPDMSKFTHQQRGNYDQTLMNVESAMRQHTGTETLSENVWLLSLNKSLPPLTMALAGCHNHGLEIRLLPFDEKPEWIQLNANQAAKPQ